MTKRGILLHRRNVLSGLLTTAATAALGAAPSVVERPVPRPGPKVPRAAVQGPQPSKSDALVRSAKLGGDVSFAVMDVDSGTVFERRMGDKRLPPASTLKVVTALYALDRLGENHRFQTRVLVTGPVTNGRVEGDLILAGGGDPTLDTDRLAGLAKALREAGVTEVTGRFLAWSAALPRGKRIDVEQPEHVAYNPSYGGLNLNFNRVHFQWERSRDDYEITMHARGRNFSPSTRVSQMAISERKAPVFEYRDYGRRDQWSVAKWALGKDGARWLPVRYPALYCADVFRTLARSNGIVLRSAELIEELPAAQDLVSVDSQPLVPMLQGMLKFSTNLTAEAVGMSASVTRGRVAGLPGSGARMGSWAMASFGADARFLDHSGLGYASSITSVDMARILAANPSVAPLLKRVNLSTDKNTPDLKDVEVLAKTGTLNFVSSLAGFVTTKSGRKLAFSIQTADTQRRDAIPPAERERPPGSTSWARRSRRLQKQLLREWATRLD